jgi:TonB family protein
MNCNGVAAILEDHRVMRLTPAERCDVDQHLQDCADCAAAWHADDALRALRIPAASASMLKRVQNALAATAPWIATPRRRARATWLIGALVAAGAALAGVAVVSLTAPPSADTAVTPTSAPPAGATAVAAPDPSAASAPADAAPPNGHAIASEFVTTSMQLVPFLRVPPVYPPEPLAEGLEGRVVIELDVTATGEVEDARVAESTDARFDASALTAVQQWKYLPRIVAGKRAAADDIRVTVNYRPSPNVATQAAVERATTPIGPGLTLDSAAFESTMLTAWQRVIADDLRGAELALDEFRATYALTPFITGEVWNAYAYVYTLEGSYDRAIDAYEQAITVFEQAGSSQGRWVELANLYFARNQYDMALNTLLRPRRASGDSTRPQMTPEAEALMQKLRALGITEETVPAR